VNIYVTDGSLGSGLYRLEVWSDEDGSNSLFKNYNTKYDLDNTYYVPDLTNGSYTIVAYDQAGNWLDSERV